MDEKKERIKDIINKLYNVGDNAEIIKALKGEVIINPHLPNVKTNVKKLEEYLSSQDKTNTIS